MSGRTFIKWVLPLLLLLLFLQNLEDGEIAKWQDSSLVLKSDSWSDLIHHPWTLLSYSFVHNSWWHILPSLLLLVVVIGWSRFTCIELWGFFVVGSVIGGLLFYVVTLGSGAKLTGASGGVATLVFAFLTVEGFLRLRQKGFGVRGSWLPLLLLLLFGLLDFLTYPADMVAGYLVHIAGYIVGFVAGVLLFAIYCKKSLFLYFSEKQSFKDVLTKAKNSGYSALSVEERRILNEMN